MAKLPQVSGQELCRAIEKEDFIFVRQTGSHRIYQKQTEEGKITVPVPVHSNKPLKKGTLQNILKKAGISREKLVFLISLLLL
ncbi:MAG: type II toxin-antitoxin system HicA family toxin [Thermodesulfovibrionales bacterium]|nr:type II toxin-antitoxin system HicA family toxin [Thermodesulfovibrionales bacterium]